MKFKDIDFKFIIPVSLFYLLIEILGVSCPIKFLTGISCAGCGMSRAIWSLVHLDVHSAFHYHPLFVFPFVALILILFRNKIGTKVFNMCFYLMALIMLVVYMIRMFDPSDTIVVFEPQNNIIHSMLQLFKGVK